MQNRTIFFVAVAIDSNEEEICTLDQAAEWMAAVVSKSASTSVDVVTYATIEDMQIDSKERAGIFTVEAGTLINGDAPKFINHYLCPDCKNEWTDLWGAQVDNDCPRCHHRAIPPHRSEDA